MTISLEKDHKLMGHCYNGDLYESNGKQFNIIGNYKRMKDAKEDCEQSSLIKIKGYLNCKYKRGWVTYSILGDK